MQTYPPVSITCSNKDRDGRLSFLCYHRAVYLLLLLSVYAHTGLPSHYSCILTEFPEADFLQKALSSEMGRAIRGNLKTWWNVSFTTWFEQMWFSDCCRCYVGSRNEKARLCKSCSELLPLCKTHKDRLINDPSVKWMTSIQSIVIILFISRCVLLLSDAQARKWSSKTAL